MVVSRNQGTILTPIYYRYIYLTVQGLGFKAAESSKNPARVGPGDLEFPVL